MTNKCSYNEFLMNFLGDEKMKTREKKRVVNFDFIFQTTFLGNFFFKKNQHIHFLVHGHSFLSTFELHLARGPKTLQIVFTLRNRTMKKDHLPRSTFMVHDVNQL